MPTLFLQALGVGGVFAGVSPKQNLLSEALNINITP
jgi:hypothetical protein